MLSGGRGTGSDEPADRSVYSANRKRSGSRLRAAAIVGALLGAATVGFTLANLYAPDPESPVAISPDPVISLVTIGAAGGVVVLFSLLVYVYARRAGV